MTLRLRYLRRNCRKSRAWNRLRWFLPAVRVEVNPQPLSDYNVGLDQVGTFLQNANANKPKGSLSNSEEEIPIYSSDQLFLAKDYKDLVVVYRNGAPVRLSDLGHVIDANEDVRNLGIVNGNPMVQIQINRQPNANIVETVARIKALMPQFRAQLPQPFASRSPAIAPSRPRNP